jgi:exodeoxyribonuclease VII large subunit
MPESLGAALTPSREILSVGELTRRVKQTLEGGFGAIWLTGEVSNLRAPSSGHIYLTLKDADAQIRAVIWGSTARYLVDKPQNGQQILCRARLTVYEPRGDYQVVLDYLEPAGVGQLYRQIEISRARLAIAGLFDADRKKDLPTLPTRVAVVTSASGAALQDILNVLERRAPGLSVLLVPSAVQGNSAPKELVQGLEAVANLTADDSVDAVILARGGGSLEDLMAFNSEAVVRAVSACPIPVVTGVGHETDTTLVDYAADLRAPTPSAAAELVSAAWGELRQRHNSLLKRMGQAVQGHIQAASLSALAARRGLIDPRDRLRHTAQRIDDLRGHLEKLISTRLAAANHQQRTAALRLTAAAPSSAIPLLSERTGALNHRLKRAMALRLDRSRARLAERAGQLQELSPLAVLGRGYAIARKNGAIIRRDSEVRPGERISVRLHQGEIDCQVIEPEG